MSKASRSIAILMCACTLVSAEAAAQYPFGKNKIQYTAKDWKIIETPHTEIFYYPDELTIAEFIADLSEEVYREYADYFNVDFEDKIPIILYGSHHDFKETNVIPFLISEGTGGFTEFIKGRVAIPFMGSYGKLKAVFRHELTHAFMLEKLRVVMSEHRRYTYNHPPLWFTEGLAEYLANGGMDSNANMFIRDAVLSETFFPLKQLWRINGTYLLYKEGESALHYIATCFGSDAIRVILENWWKSDKFDLVLKKSIGLNVTELSRDWEEYLKKRYFPSIMNRRRISEIGEILSEEERSFEVFPVSIGGSGEAEKIFCIGFGPGSIDLLEFKRDDRGVWRRKTLIRGGRSTNFESIPLLRSRLSLKGDTLLFVAKVGERDAMYLYDVEQRKMLRQILLPDARILNSPTASHNNRYLAFSAIDYHGRSDLFLYDLESSSFRRLTEDFYDDVFPDWHPRKNLLVFSSDRCTDDPGDRYALYTIDPETLVIEALTDGVYHDTDPRWMPDGSSILFSSDREGVYDIFLLQDKQIIRQTNILGGAFHPWPMPDGKGFLTAAYCGGTYQVYRAPLKEDTQVVALERSAPVQSSWVPRSLGVHQDFEKKDYRLKMGIDFIGAAFAVDPDFGSFGNGAQLFLTDVLGNHQMVILFGSASDDFSDFWKNINVAFTYINLTRRLNYALGAFHLASYMGGPYDLFRFERRYGVLAGVSYPFSKFTRVELSTVVKAMERDDDLTFIGLQEGSSWLVSNYLSFTTDNITWYIGGPLNGHRLNVALGNNIDVNGSRYESTTLHLDVRNYINITRRIIFAQRMVSRNAWGSDLQLFYLGGSWDLRGYNFREFAGKRIVLLNNELRFPLIDRLLLRFPFGFIDFPIFRGSLFFDVGRVEGFIFDTDWIGSFGTGVEMNLGYLPVVRVNFCRLTDFKSIERGTKIDFFLGFNF